MTIYINHAEQTDIPAVLRQLAADIEAGQIGPLLGCAVVLDLVNPVMSSRVMVSYAGNGDAVPSAHLLMHKGMTKMVGSLP